MPRSGFLVNFIKEFFVSNLFGIRTARIRIRKLFIPDPTPEPAKKVMNPTRSESDSRYTTLCKYKTLPLKNLQY